MHRQEPCTQLLGPLPVRRRLPPRGDRPRPAGVRLHPGLAALVDRGVRAALGRPARLLLRAVTGPFDVCVVGGGPAGAGLAAALARTGHRVAVVEQRVFPRDHVGESLSPGAWPLLDSLGIARSAVEAVAASGPDRAGVRWRTEREERVRVGAGSPSTAARFDALLLDHARAAGPTCPPAPGPPAGAYARRLAGAARRREPVEARFLADASGRRALLGGRRIWTSPRVRWPCTPGGRAAAPADGPQTRCAALAEGWLWWAQLPGSRGAGHGVARPSDRGARTRDPGRLFRRLLSRLARGRGPLAGCRRSALCGLRRHSYRFGRVATSTRSASARPRSRSTRCRPPACRRRCRPGWPRPPRFTPC